MNNINYLIKTESEEKVVTTLCYFQDGYLAEDSYLFGDSNIHRAIELLKNTGVVDFIISDERKSLGKAFKDIPNVDALKEGYFTWATYKSIMNKNYTYAYNIRTGELVKGFPESNFKVEKCLLAFDDEEEIYGFSSYETLKLLDYTDSYFVHETEKRISMGKEIEVETVCMVVYARFYRNLSSNRVIMGISRVNQLSHYGEDEDIFPQFLLEESDFSEKDKLVYDKFMELYNSGKVHDMPYTYEDEGDMPF